jgi:hypothetical protein
MQFLAAAWISILGNPPDCLRVEMVRAEGLEPPHLSTTGPKPAASTNSATRADAVGGAAYNRRGRFGNPKQAGNCLFSGAFEGPGERLMQQPEPNEPPTTPSPPLPEPSQPGQPTEPPPGIPTHAPDIDVPSPPSPGTTPTGPISPVG